jgi:hypothetical protein
MNWLIKLFGRKKQYDFAPLEQVIREWVKK